MENEEMMVEETFEESCNDYQEPANKKSGLKTVGILAIVAAVGTGLFIGAKKISKKIKAKKADEQYIGHDLDVKDE